MWQTVPITNAIELTSMVCLLGLGLGIYMLLFLIYARAKTKEYQTSTGLEKIKAFINTMLYTHGVLT